MLDRIKRVRRVAGLLVAAFALTACGAPEVPAARPAVQILKIMPGDGPTVSHVAVLRQTGDAGRTGDHEADRAFSAATAVLERANQMGRDSWDGQGDTLRVYVRAATDSEHGPSWNRELHAVQLSAGQVSIKRVASGFMQGVVQAQAGLGGRTDEPGALGIAITDAFGALARNEWFHGDPDRVLRDFRVPVHVRDYQAASDEAAMYRNSVIPAHAFYRLTEEIDDADRAERILWDVVLHRLPRDAGFVVFRSGCVDASTALYGDLARRAAERAFAGVGLDADWRAPAR